jgi:hypothetical protein
LARVAYRFHPLFGQEVYVVRRVKSREEPSVIVQGERDLRLMVPCWMLSEGCCEEMAVEEEPRIAVEALAELRALIDAQHLAAGGPGAGCDSMTVDEQCHESP